MQSLGVGRGACGTRAFEAVLVINNLPANAEDAREVISIPLSGRSSGRGNGNPLQYNAGKIPWTEEPGGLQCMEL